MGLRKHLRSQCFSIQTDRYLRHVHERLNGQGIGKNKTQSVSSISIEEKDIILKNVETVIKDYGGGYGRRGATTFERSRIFNDKMADARLIQKCLEMHFKNLELEVEGEKFATVQTAWLFKYS